MTNYPLRTAAAPENIDLPLSDPLNSTSSKPAERFEHLFRRLRQALGLDRATLFTIFARGWSACAGFLTILLITRFLSGLQQGYYFTISSLLALQIVFELGFSFVILQLASHETAHLTVTTTYVKGDEAAQARLSSVLRKTISYYGLMSLVMCVALVPGGILFFKSNQHSGSGNSWFAPWCVAVALTSINLFVTPLMSFLEGCGFVAETAKARFAQAFVGSLLAWGALAGGCGLYAPGLMIGGQAVCGCVWFFRRRQILRSIWRQYKREQSVSWRTDIWPFQWRMAVCWLCGYFAFQLFSPVIFAFQGPIAAGQMGLSLSVATALANMALAWINTKAAPFGTLVAKREFEKLDNIYFIALKQSSTLMVMGCIGLWCSVFACTKLYPALSQRFLSLPWLALLLVTTALNHVVFCQAIYLRAHKREVFLTLHIVSAVIVGIGTYYLGKYSGVGGVTASYFLGRGVLCLILGTWTFEKKRREWHR